MKRLLYILFFSLTITPLMATEPMDTILLATLMENGQYEDVVRLTTRELEHFPKSGAMYYYRSIARVHQSNLPGALEDIHQAIRYPKESPMTLPDMHLLRAGMYILLSDTFAAINDCNMAIRRAGKHPRNCRYYVRRANVYAYYDYYAEAAADYQTACKIEPENASLQLELARYLALSGRVAEAQQLLEDLCALHPEQIEAPQLLAALLCYVKEEYNEAVDWAITALTRRYVSDRTVGDADMIFLAGAIDYSYVYRALSNEITRYNAQEQYGLRDLFYLLRGILLGQHGYAEDALADLDSVSSFSFPRNYEEFIKAERLTCHEKARHWQEVIDMSTEFIKQNPDSSPYYVTRSNAYFETEQYALAETDLKTLYAVYPSAENAYRLGTLYYQWQHYPEAIRYFSMVLEQEELEEEAKRVARLLRGESYLHTQDTLSATPDFERILETDTTYRNTVRHYALYRLGRTKEALEWVEQLIREYPEAQNYYDAACLYAQEQDTARALQHLEISLRWGHPSPRQILYDSDLNNLRDHPDFQALVQRYAPAGKPKNVPTIKSKQATASKKK